MSAQQNGNIPGSRQAHTKVGPGGQADRPAESQGGSLGTQQQDDEGGLGGQGPGTRRREQPHKERQIDDNQDDLGRDANDPGQKSTNHPPG
jgi:hypothetical protein